MNNLFDDPEFFERYIALRSRPDYWNDVLEQPEMLRLIGNVRGARVLDLGCGYGALTTKLADGGAELALGLDISTRMIELARRKYSRPNIIYQVHDASALSALTVEIHFRLGKQSEHIPCQNFFNVVVSSLMLHYLKNIKPFFDGVYRLLKPGGRFIFSTEHPLYTCMLPPPNERDSSCYPYTSPVSAHWLGASYTKFHRMFEDILNPLLQSGFRLQAVSEPFDSEAKADIQRFLIVKCAKP